MFYQNKYLTGLRKYIFSKVDFPYAIYTFIIDCKISIPLMLGRGKTYTDSLDWLWGCLCGRGSDDRHPLLQHLRSHLADIICHRLFTKVWHSSFGYIFGLGFLSKGVFRLMYRRNNVCNGRLHSRFYFVCRSECRLSIFRDEDTFLFHLLS